MFERLKDKWGVGALQLILILCTFAIGGSLSGYLAKKIMGSTEGAGILWWFAYILVVTILWPLCVLSVSTIFGQYKFFIKYLKKMGQRMRLIKKE